MSSSADRKAPSDAINEAFDEADRTERLEEAEDDAALLAKAEKAMERHARG